MNTVAIRHFLFGLLAIFWVSMGQAQAPSAMVLSVEGDVSVEVLGKPGKLDAFTRLLEGDRVKLGKSAKLSLIYTRSSRQESWTGPGAIVAGNAESTAVNGKPQVEVKQLPAKVAQMMAHTPAADSTGKAGMVRLRDGRFIVISETSRPKGPLARTGREALMFAGDPTEAPDRGFGFVYVPPAGFDPSDMTELPDGRLLILNRRFAVPSLFTATITLVDPGAIRPGAVVQGREIAAFAAPLLHDNFEALAVTREGKDTILWMASDDNQQFWERSLLLKFRVDL